MQNPDGSLAVVGGRFVELDPSGLIRMTWCWERWPDGPTGEESLVTVRLEPASGSTLLTLTRDDVLQRRIRAHGNFIEYAPTLLLTLALVEIAGAPPAIVMGLAVAVVGGRLLHAAGMLWFETPAPRGIAMLATHSVYLLGGGWLLWHFA